MREVDRPSIVFIYINIQYLHQAAIEFSPRWIFLRTQPPLRSYAYRQVSSAKRAKFTPGC
jgi:hypothetical protein